MADYDVVIVGGGPAGLTSGIYCVRRNLKALVVERAALGGQVNLTPEIENWPGDRRPILRRVKATRLCPGKR